MKEALQNHMNTLVHVINNNLELPYNSRLEKTIEGLGFYFKQHNLTISVKMNITSMPCSICKNHIREINKNSAVKLNCGHICCSDECLQNLVKTHALTEYEMTKCPSCDMFIHFKIIENAFGGNEKFRILLENYEEEVSAKFTCNICFMTFRVDQSITLDCDHRFNEECIQGLVEMNIDEGNVEENALVCPECGHPISVAIIKNLVDKKRFDKYNKFALRNFRPNEEGPTVFYKCSGNDCEFFAIFEENVEYIKCPSCGIVNCPKCRDKPHRGITCDENHKRKREEEERLAKEKKDNAIDEEFKNAAKALGYKTCPHCKSMCEKISGCKFMRCFSPFCKGKNNFCLLCEKAITEAQHYSHYKAKGPYGEICNTMDGTKED